MKLSFVTTGKIKSPECKNLVDYYLKLTGKFADVEHIVIYPTQDRDAYFLNWLEKRSPRAFLTLLDERGKIFESREFAKRVEKIQDSSPSEWIILCGFEHGFGEAVKNRAGLVWSLSSLTFPHEMAAAIAAEQIFRAFTILKKHPYHND